jgi:hypothetical protein
MGGFAGLKPGTLQKALVGTELNIYQIRQFHDIADIVSNIGSFFILF